jgi:heme oxygenase
MRENHVFNPTNNALKSNKERIFLFNKAISHPLHKLLIQFLSNYLFHHLTQEFRLNSIEDNFPSVYALQ